MIKIITLFKVAILFIAVVSVSAQEKLNESRLVMRSVYGGKLFREIIYK